MLLFHQECNVLWIPPTPVIKFSATLPSHTQWSAVPSFQTTIELSSGPNVLGSFLSSVHRGRCGGLDIFRYLYGHLFGLIFEFRVIFSISRNYFFISENLKNRTCLDFERSQWMKKHKIGSTRVHDVVIFIP